MTAQHHADPDAFVRLRAGGWLVSLCLHGTAILLAALFIAKIGLAPPSPSFRWDVAVVSAPNATDMPSAAPSESSATPEATGPIQRTVPIAAPRPATSQPSRLRPTAVESAPLPVEPKMTEPVPPSPIQPVQHKSEALTAPPPSAPEKTMTELLPPIPTPQSTRELRPDAEEAAATSQLPETTPVPEPSPSSSKEQAPGSISAPTQTAALTPPTPPGTVARKPDYGWFAATLLPRIESLKQYPAEARLKHLEGRVLVRVVVQEDGQIVSATIAKSSGHDILDQAALETLQKSSPIMLTQPLGKSSVTLQIPINYQLAQ